MAVDNSGVLVIAEGSGRGRPGFSNSDGEYTISVSLENNGGDEIPFTTLMTGAVDGLRYENNQAVVVVGGLEYYVSEIYKVS